MIAPGKVDANAAIPPQRYGICRGCGLPRFLRSTRCAACRKEATT